jgi:hypothetical protein
MCNLVKTPRICHQLANTVSTLEEEMSIDEKKKVVSRDSLPKHIKKSHQIVFSRQDLSAREADIFALMIATMKESDWVGTTPKYEFSASQLSNWLNIAPKHIATYLNPVAMRLSRYSVGIKTEDGNGEIEFDYKPIFKNISYKNRTFTMIPNDLLKSEFIEYKQGFALINTTSFLCIKQEYAKRLYEILSRFKEPGYEMHLIKLDELKGLFGLYDEKGNLKSDKLSFKNNGVFMQRCIRSSIDILKANPTTNKELLFYESANGEVGYELKKQGNKIIAIKFLMSWITKGNIEEFNERNAITTIKKLELKRQQLKSEGNGKKLSTAELKLLLSAYNYTGNEKLSNKIATTLIERRNNRAEQASSKEEIDIANKLTIDNLDIPY